MDCVWWVIYRSLSKLYSHRHIRLSGFKCPRFESKAAFCQKQVGILALPSTLISAILILVRKYFNKQKPHSFSSWFSEWIHSTEGGELNLIRLTLNWIGILTNISHQASNKAVRLIWIESSYFLSLVRGSAPKRVRSNYFGLNCHVFSAAPRWERVHEKTADRSLWHLCIVWAHCVTSYVIPVALNCDTSYVQLASPVDLCQLFLLICPPSP